MVTFIQKVENMLEDKEKIICKIIVQRMIKSASTIIVLTNKRLIYFGCISARLKSVPLPNVESIFYIPRPLHSGGIIKLLTKRGKNILLSPSFVGQEEAREFIKEVEKWMKKTSKH